MSFWLYFGQKEASARWKHLIFDEGAHQDASSLPAWLFYIPCSRHTFGPERTHTQETTVRLFKYAPFRLGVCRGECRVSCSEKDNNRSEPGWISELKFFSIICGPFFTIRNHCVHFPRVRCVAAFEKITKEDVEQQFGNETGISSQWPTKCERVICMRARTMNAYTHKRHGKKKKTPSCASPCIPFAYKGLFWCVCVYGRARSATLPLSSLSNTHTCDKSSCPALLIYFLYLWVCLWRPTTKNDLCVLGRDELGFCVAQTAFNLTLQLTQ